MTGSPPLAPPPSVAAVVAITVLAVLLGFDLAGLHGAQAGCAAGLITSFAPFGLTRVRAWLTLPSGLPRLIGREVAAAIVRAASLVAARIVRALGPVAHAVVRALLLPTLLVRFVASALLGLASQAMAGVFRRLATPLGLANLAAVAIIVGDAARIEFASLACFAGLFLLVLVLLVNASESPTKSR